MRPSLLLLSSILFSLLAIGRTHALLLGALPSGVNPYIPTVPLSGNLSIVIDSGSISLGNITIYPIDINATILTKELPIDYHAHGLDLYTMDDTSFSVPVSVLEAILPASGYNITYQYQSKMLSSLVYVTTDVNGTIVLVDSNEDEDSWSWQMSRNASTYAASSILAFLFLTILVLWVCSTYSDPTLVPVPVPVTGDTPLLKKTKKKTKKLQQQQHHDHRHNNSHSHKKSTKKSNSHKKKHRKRSSSSSDDSSSSADNSV
jgi:hypothetical protein